MWSLQTFSDITNLHNIGSEKDMHLKNPLAYSKAQQIIVNMMHNDNNIVENETLPTAEPDGSNTDKHCDLWGLRLHKS